MMVLILPNVILCITESIVPIGKATLILLPLAIYWGLMSIGNRVSKSYWYMFPILFLGAFNIVLSYLFGKGIIAVDMWLNLATTSPNEAGEMLSQIYPAVIAVVVIYLPTLGYAIYDIKKGKALDRKFLRQMRMTAAALMVAAIPVTAMALQNPKYAFLDDMFPVNVCYNFRLAVSRQIASTKYLETSSNFRYDAECIDSDTIPQVVVLVIGETSRATNWQLMGYDRETNPELSKVIGLVSFSDCLSQSNTTHKSVPILLSPATAEDYSTLYTSKGIFEAFNEAGYQTVFISNEPRNHSFNDRLGEQAQEVIFLRDSLPGDPKDTLLLPRIERKLVEHSTGHLMMVVHSYGSHSTYSDRYLQDQSYYQPDQVIKATRDNREILINAYDNTIRYTDHVLASIIGMLQKTQRPAAMMYISDHGEDIYDDDRNLYLHASPWPSYYQLHVPLLVWTSPQYAQTYPVRTALIRSRAEDPVQSDAVFPTMLTLGGIRTPYGQDTLSLASVEYRIKPERHYLTDHNKSVTLDRCLEKQDFEVMKKRGMRVH